MKKLAMVLGLLLLAQPLVAEVAVTVGYHSPTDKGMAAAPQYGVRWGGERYYLWGSYSSHTQVDQTQRIGDVALLGAGVGFHRDVIEGVRFFAEVGVGRLSEDYSTRVMREVVYYKFAPIFGEPPFLPDGGWWSLEQVYKPDAQAPIIRFGASVELTPQVSLELAYMRFGTSLYFSTWNPDVNGGPVAGNFDACGCLWEGQDELNLSGMSIGLTYSF